MSGKVQVLRSFLSSDLGRFLPGVLYFVAAKLSLFLAIPPSEAVAVWPPAGIAVGALLVGGWRVFPGLCMGVLLFNLNLWLDTESLVSLISSGFMAVLLSIGPLLQAVLSTHLIHRVLGQNNALIEERSIILFLLLAGPVGCLIAASISLPILTIYGVLPMADFAFNWLNWWVGDSIGAVVVTPIILIMFLNTDTAVSNRKYAVGIPLLILLLMVFSSFSVVQSREKEEFFLSFDKAVNAQHSKITSGTEDSLALLYFMRSFFEASDKVSQKDFNDFTRQSLRNNRHIQALEWIPRVSDAERYSFEHTGDAAYLITEADEKGQRVPARQADFYYVIKYARPLLGNETALGYNIRSNPEARISLERAIETGDPAATSAFRLIQETENKQGFVIYLTVRKRSFNDDEEVQFGDVIGVVAAVFKLDDFIREISGINAGVIPLVSQRVIDLNRDGKVLYKSADMDDSLSAHRVMNVKVSRTINVAGRLWQIDYFPNREFIKEHSSSSGWLILVGGMLFSGLLSGWLLSLTGRNIQVNQVVTEKTEFLLQEIERRKQVEAEITKLSLAVEHSPNMVVITDAVGNIEYVNPKFTQITGYQLDEVTGKNISILHSGDLEGYSYEEIWEQLRRKSEWRGEVLNRNKQGEFYWAEIHFSAISDKNTDCTHYVSVHQDITESKIIAEKISYQASHDLLTGLINRREFERRLEHLMKTAQSEQVEHAFCFLDLDQFKVVNDTSGHVAGDELLRQLGAMLLEKIRKSDTIARLGGDEFGILMEHCSLFDAQRMAEQIREAIEEFKFSWGDRTFSIGVSIGLVSITENSQSSMEVFKQADSACYAAKDGGRNRIHLYQEDDEVLARRSGEIHWVTDINAALEENRFELFGQLIKPIQETGEAPGIEVLLRLQERDGSLVPPGAFLPAAERYNISTRIDNWVINHVFDWLEREPDVINRIAYCAINLSGQSLGDQSILQNLTRQLSRQVVPAEMIKFEITETTAIGNLAEAKEFINTVKQFGCQFALDDFGSGLSSFAYLKHLSVDVLKIDGLFVKDIMDDEIDFAMVKSINEVGHVMGMKTTAEFVENDAILERLAGIGVDYAQGYGICRPMSLQELMQHPMLKPTVTSHQQPAQVVDSGCS